MPNWLRVTLAIAAGFIIWFVVATAGNFVIRWLVPGYTDAEKVMSFSMAMLSARLVLGAVASFVAGAVCGTIAPTGRTAVYWFALLLVVLFALVHVNLWAKFPVWYHVVFLVSLAPLVVLGATVVGSRGMRAA